MKLLARCFKLDRSRARYNDTRSKPVQEGTRGIANGDRNLRRGYLNRLLLIPIRISDLWMSLENDSLLFSVQISDQDLKQVLKKALKKDV